VLEARGVDWSRNRNFYLFSESGPRRALALRRRLAAIASFVHAHGARGLRVTRAAVEGPYPIELRLHAPRIAATLVARLDRDELALLRRDAQVDEALAGADP
jgi:hypothetical protein